MAAVDPAARGALEAAQAKLLVVGDRDAILDVLFDHAKDVFDFTVLFVIRGDAVRGRDVYGLGAPSGLVARLEFPATGAGILGRAVEYKKTYVATPDAEGEDADLLGRLGRAMPTCVVSPIVVRGRVVAVLVGQGVAASVGERARASGSAPYDVAKDMMIAWTDCVGDAFERLIVRRKSDDGALVASLRRPPVSRDSISRDNIATPASHSTSTPNATPAAGEAEPKRSSLVLVLVAVVGLAAVAALAFRFSRAEPGPGDVVRLASALPGHPKVDLQAMVGPALDAADLPGGELLRIQTVIEKGGVVDVVTPRDEPTIIAFLVGTTEAEAEVRVDAAGLHGPRRQPRSLCDGQPCGLPVSRPTCTTAMLWDAAAAAGARGDDRVRTVYAATRDSGPQWSLVLPERGTIPVDGVKCTPLTRERFRAPKRALASLPGAPHAVDPLEVMPLAQEQSALGNEARLLEIEALGVGANGKVDLSSPDTRIVYRFGDPDSVPLTERRWRQVVVGPEGMPITPITTDREPRPLRVKSAVSRPRCSFAAAWKMAAIPGDAKARILYGSDPSFPESGQWTVESAAVKQSVVSPDAACSQGASPPAPPQPPAAPQPQAPPAPASSATP